jgi:hypothetical protein
MLTRDDLQKLASRPFIENRRRRKEPASLEKRCVCNRPVKRSVNTKAPFINVAQSIPDRLLDE